MSPVTPPCLDQTERRRSGLPTRRRPLGGNSQKLVGRLAAALLFSELFSSAAILFPPTSGECGQHPAVTPAAVKTVLGDAHLTEATGTSGHELLTTPPHEERSATPLHNEIVRYHPVTNQPSPLSEAAPESVDTRTQALLRYYGVRLSIALSAILTAGVMVALMRRRLRSSGSNPLGQLGTGFRLAADVRAAQFLDQALRLLSAELTAAGRALPSVYAATLSDSELVLHFAPVEPDGPPAPWRAGEIPGAWLIERVATTMDGLPVDAGLRIPAGTPAPYPGLATVGTDDRGAHVLIDIEAAPGIVSLGGDAALAREVAVSIAVELSTNPWSDDLRIYMIGFSERFVPIAPNRLRSSTSLGEILDELENRESRRGRTTGGGVLSSGPRPVLRGRQAARNQVLWAPDLLVLSAPPSGDEVARLSALCGGPNRGVGVVTVGDSTAARWRFMVSSARRLHLGVLGLEISAQTLSTHEYPAIIKMFRKANTVYTIPGPARAISHTTGTKTVDPSYPYPAFPPPQQVSSPGAQSLRRSDLRGDAAQLGNRRRGSAEAGEVIAFPDGKRRTPTPDAAQMLTPWVPEVPPWMRPHTSATASEPLRRDHPPIPPVPPVPPPSAPPRTPPPAIAPPAGRPPKPPLPPSEPPTRFAEHSDSPDPAEHIHDLFLSESTSTQGFRDTSAWENGAMPEWEARAAEAPAEPVSLRSPSAQDMPPHPLPSPTVFPAGAPRLPSAHPLDEIWPAPSPIPTAQPLKAAEPVAQPPWRIPPSELLAGTAPTDGSLPWTGPPGSTLLPVLSAPPPQPAASPPAVPPPAVPPPAVPPPVMLSAGSGNSSQSTDAEIRIMGDIAVEAPGPCNPDRRDFLTELVVYLALHRSGVLPGVLSAALLPPGAADDMIRGALDQVRTWLGADDGGHPRITVGDDGRWRLADGVRCDWDFFVAYAHRSAQPESDAESDLTTALRLVTGPLWANLPKGYYRWLASSRIRTTTATAVVDVAHRLASLTLGHGDTVTAIAACRTGLRAAPTAEVLWRDLLRTVAARRDRKALEAVINEMYQMIAPRRTGLKVQAETDALVHELLPGFRRR